MPQRPSSSMESPLEIQDPVRHCLQPAHGELPREAGSGGGEQDRVRMKIGIAKERRAHELRVAVTPDTARKFIALGAEVAIEAGAGLGASYTDQAYAAAGAKIVPDETAAIGDADIVLKVQRPLTTAEGGPDELALLKRGTMLVGILSPHGAKEQLALYAQQG